MIFAHDVEAALAATADLVNTAARGEEHLRDESSVAEFVARHDYSSSSVKGVAVRRMHVLRARLAHVWRITELDELVAYLNAALEDSDARPSLMRHEHWDWHLHYTPIGAPLDRIVLAEAAMAFVAMFQQGELSRLKVCAAPDCDAVLVDLSRNRSRRYCDTANCGNRANVAAYRARQRGAAHSASVAH